MPEAPDPNEIVAYNEGSFWFCPGCAQERGDTRDPARRRDLMAVYTYRCDQCRRPIA